MPHDLLRDLRRDAGPREIRAKRRPQRVQIDDATLGIALRDDLGHGHLAARATFAVPAHLDRAVRVQDVDALGEAGREEVVHARAAVHDRRKDAVVRFRFLIRLARLQLNGKIRMQRQQVVATRLAAADEDRAGVEVDIDPLQSAQVAKTQAGERSRQIPRAAPALRCNREQPGKFIIGERATNAPPIATFVRLLHRAHEVCRHPALRDAPVAEGDSRGANVIHPAPRLPRALQAGQVSGQQLGREIRQTNRPALFDNRAKLFLFADDERLVLSFSSTVRDVIVNVGGDRLQTRVRDDCFGDRDDPVAALRNFFEPLGEHPRRRSAIGRL